MNDLRTPLKKARGRGSAHGGTGHFIVQRATGVFLIPLLVFFMASIVANVGADYPTMIAYLSHPVVSAVMILLMLTALYHIRVSVQVPIDDYIGKTGTRIFLLLLLNFFVIAVGLASVLAILHISFMR